MRNKKGIELSVNFIVILIISIIIFGFGLRFISQLFSQAVELQDLTINEIDKKIGDLVCEGSDRVCVGIDKKIIRRSKVDYFGIKIINILESQNFDVIISRPTPSGYAKSKTEIKSDNLKWIPKSRSLFIDKNEEKNAGVAVQIPANAASGTYIFDVIIQTSDGQSYSNVQKFYVEVP